MTNDYYQAFTEPPPTKEERLREMVGELSRRYQSKPSRMFLQSVVDILNESCSLEEAGQVIANITKSTFAKFPTIKDLRYHIRAHRRFIEQMKMRDEKEEGYEKRIKDIPMRWETIFQMIRSNRINSPAFNFARRRFKISDEELNEAYECWERGEVHEIIKEEMESIE